MANRFLLTLLVLSSTCVVRYAAAASFVAPSVVSSRTNFARARGSNCGSSLHVYHFGADGSKDNGDGNSPYRGKVSQYVPDGLTLEEYNKIKQKEQKQQSKMNFGAWGPRFQTTNAPGGNWFSVASLWTGGFNPNADASVNGSTNADGKIGVAMWLRRYGVSYCMLLFATQFAFSRLLSQRALPATLVPIFARLSPPAAHILSYVVKFLFASIVLNPVITISSFAKRREFVLMKSFGVEKAALVVSALMVLASSIIRLNVF